MQRRFMCVMVLGLAAMTACEHKSVDSSSGLGIPTRMAVGDMPDNPMVGKIPSDTPYAMVTFRPMPLDMIQKWGAVALPIWRKALEAAATPDADDKIILQDVLGALDHLDVATVEAQGFTRNARFAVYGLGAYPAMRIDLADGDKVFALVQRLAERWHKPLPPPTTRAGGRFWQIDTAKASILLAILPKELIAAVAPKDVMDSQLATLLGEQKPAQAMTAAQFKAIADRDGFSGFAIGFADTARITGLLAKEAPTPACSEALAGLAKRIPRVAMGYGDFTTQKISFGLVAELAADPLADARSMVGKIAGVDGLLTTKPIAAFAAAIDVEHARTAAAHAATVLADFGTRCDIPSIAEGAQKMVAGLAKPLPPFVGGLHGGYAVLSKLQISGQGPPSFEGFGSLQIDNAGEVIKLAQLKLPTLQLPTDGKSHALPPEVPLKGHAAATDHAIGFSTGPTSEADAVRGLGGKADAAPLAVMALDYSRLGSSIPLPADPSGLMTPADMQKMFSMIGMLVMQLVIDDRGAVLWMSMESR